MVIKEKHGLEQGAVMQLISVLTKRYPLLHIEFDKLLKPPFPDARCIVNGSPVYIEVTHIYGTEVDTRYLLGRKGKAKPTHKERLGASCIPLKFRYLIPLNRILQKKASKTYTASPVWLVVRNGLPIWTEEDFRSHILDIVVPETHPFQKIFFLCGPRDLFGMIELTNSEL